MTVTGQAGTFTLTFNGQTTPSLAYNATAGEVGADLQALSTIGDAGGTVNVNGKTTIYQLTVTGTSSDVFTLSFGVQTTGNLNPASSTLAADMQTALLKLSNIVGAGGVVVTEVGRLQRL